MIGNLIFHKIFKGADVIVLADNDESGSTFKQSSMTRGIVARA